MSDKSNRAVARYLRELRKELDDHGVVGAEDAISDADEFLQNEIVAIRDSWGSLLEAEYYAHFVEQYGTPRVVALGYLDAVPLEARTSAGGDGYLRFARVPWKRRAAATLVFSGMVALCVAGYFHEAPKLSPFTEVRYGERDEVVVRVDDRMYRLVAIDKLPVQGILQSARAHFGDLWQKRFAEDLVEVMWRMGHRPGTTVKLELRDLETDKTVTIEEAAMTKANRRRIWQSRAAFERQASTDAVKPEADPPKVSPFTEVRYDDEGVIVRVRGERYRLIALDGIPTEAILKSARERFDNRWRKGFAEDLVEVLWAMDHRPGTAVTLDLKGLNSNEVKKFENVPMTEENRRQIWNARNAPARGSDDALLDHGAAARIIEEFKANLRERWSYYFLSADEIETEIAALARRAAGPISTHRLALELQKIVALGIDGHAGVSSWQLDEGYLPFLIEPIEERYAAFHPDRTALLSPEHPYVVSIDGRPLEEWVHAASTLVPKGSDGYVRLHALRLLRNIEHWRGELGVPKSDDLEVELASPDGERTTMVRLAVGDRLPMYGIWPRTPSRILAGEIGYLRLPAMDEAAVDEIGRMMPKFRETTGLIIDVRDNGGGSREPLRWIDSYLTGPDDPPRVVNCAKYRLFSGFPADHLSARFMYTANSDHWSDEEREAIARFQESFVPEWEPPEEQFSAWHTMVLGRRYGEETYHYTKPVVVLMNAKCFSATDIFLAVLQEHDNVTLIGTSSGGGSARVEGVELAESGIRVTLGSMVSFRVNGQLFDGRGVAPDIVVHPRAEDFVGGGDCLLDRAIVQIQAHHAEHREPRG